MTETAPLHDYVDVALDAQGAFAAITTLRAALDRAEARVAKLEAALRDLVLPELRHTAEDLFRCVSVRLDPGSVSPSDWRDIAPAMEAVLAVEAFIGRPDDDYGARLNHILDAAPWRHHT